MKIQFNGDVESKALESLCEKKLNRLEKYFKGGEPKVSVKFSIVSKEHVVDIFTKYNSFELKSSGKSDDMYKSLDIAVDNLKMQMTKNKFDKKAKRCSREFVEEA